jgi:hypothetical protein
MIYAHTRLRHGNAREHVIAANCRMTSGALALMETGDVNV